MLSSNLDDLNEPLLQQLCKERCPESGTLDFKARLPNTSDKDKSEFLKDVCALANAEGGDLVYGIDAVGGSANTVIPISTETSDAAHRRLGQVLDAGVEPRLNGIQFHPVGVSGGYVLVVRVPPSFVGPHRYLFNNHSRFVMRIGTHTSELTYDQLRAAFDRTATLYDRALSFRDERLQAILNKHTWRPMVDGPLCVLHLIPLLSMSGRRSVDVQSIYADYGALMFDDWGGASRSFNLDGIVVHPPYDGKGLLAYTQVFRSGALEAVHFGGSSFSQTQRAIPSTMVTKFYRDAIAKSVAAAKRFGYSGPAIIGAALLRVEGFELAVGGAYNLLNSTYADRPQLQLPEAWVESIESVQDVDVIARPLMDVLWQAFGLERCLDYTQEGVWTPRK
jgi:hypothetical protein